ncbi:hypothetical protein [Komagataeibacter phage phiKX1]|nr:hypothetical protein [Komagataeibacter phage phiKX1]BCZ76106.1 hypothetical protein [Komagataeibacter phage phiKX2]
MSNRRFNLFAKEDWRAARTDETKPDGSKVPFVGVPSLLSCERERLAGRRSSPAWQVSVSSEAQGERPAADACEEMALIVFSHVLGSNISN